MKLCASFTRSRSALFRRLSGGLLCLMLLCVTSCGSKEPTGSTPLLSDTSLQTDRSTSTTTQATHTTSTTATSIQTDTVSGTSANSTTSTISTAHTSTTLTTRTTTHTTITTTTTASTTATSTTNRYAATDLFFPVAPGGHVVSPPTATLDTVHFRFEAAQLQAILQLPTSFSSVYAGEGAYTYVELYANGVRVGRIVPNFRMEDVVEGDVTDETEYGGVTVQTLRYTAADQVAITYYGFILLDDIGFCLLEMDAGSIQQEDFARCLESLQLSRLLSRDNKLYLKEKENLRIAIAGNSFIGTSCVAEQLNDILTQNGKNAYANGFCYPNYSIRLYADDPTLVDQLCGGQYDVLFLSGAYWAEDVNAISVFEEACADSGTVLVLFPAHNEGAFNVNLAYQSTTVKMAHWKEAIENLQAAGIPEADLIMYDGPRHSKPIAGYCGAVMIYGMLYECAPNAAAIGAGYSGLSTQTAQRVEELTMDYIRPYYE